MVSAKIVNAAQGQRPAPGDKPRVLLISDSFERLDALRALVGSAEIEINGITSIDEPFQACCLKYCLAVVDVGAERLIEVLQTLRSSKEYSAIPLLVEAARIWNNPDPAINLAGVLPNYRAMPCNQNDLIALMRNLYLRDSESRKAGQIL